MTSEKDEESIRKSKKLIEEQVEATKKLDLGLDADRSSRTYQKPKSIFEGFTNTNDLPHLDDK